MEHIYAIKITHGDGYVSKYKFDQPIGNITLTAIKPDEAYRIRFKKDAYTLMAKTENGTPFEWKNFRDFSEVEITNQNPDSSKEEMEEMLKLSGFYVED